jgi:Holliday junction resolvasome RuvABC DNA-binding subunit
MSDAISDAYKAQEEDKIGHALAKAIVVFLEKPTPENRAEMENSIEPAIKAMSSSRQKIEGIISRLEANDLFSFETPDLKERFLKIAEQRGIGETKWVL